MNETNQKQKTKAADRRLRNEYQISLEEYERVLKHQGFCCAICKRPIAENKTRFAVDHCHKTGLLRGLLCYLCNKFLLGFRENPALLAAAVEYLIHPPMTQVFGADRFTAPGKVGTKKRKKLLLQMKGDSVRAKRKLRSK